MTCRLVRTIAVQDADEFPNGEWMGLRIGEEEIQKRIDEAIRLMRAQRDLNFGPGFEPNIRYDEDGKAWVPIEGMEVGYN